MDLIVHGLSAYSPFQWTWLGNKVCMLTYVYTYIYIDFCTCVVCVCKDKFLLISLALSGVGFKLVFPTCLFVTSFSDSENDTFINLQYINLFIETTVWIYLVSELLYHIPIRKKFIN